MTYWQGPQMAQLEYGDYYKFISSAGIALIAGAVAVPWMFLREPFDLAIEVSKIAMLTPDAQNTIHMRQHLIAAIFHYLPEASGSMAAAGAFLIVYGLLAWRSRQSVRDKSEDLQNQKLDRELQAMSPEQIETKAKSDVIEDDGLEQGLVPLQSQPEAYSSLANSALAVEQALLGRISSCLGSSMKVMTNQRLGNVEFDAIIRAKTTERIILEIKYIRKGFNRGWLSETISNLSTRMALYAKTFDESPSGLLVVIIATSNSSLSRKVIEISEEFRISQPSRMDNIRVQTIYLDDIATIPCHELKRIVLGNS
jgi:hypothetical protein